MRGPSLHIFITGIALVVYAGSRVNRRGQSVMLAFPWIRKLTGAKSLDGLLETTSSGDCVVRMFPVRLHWAFDGWHR
jgi:hypothetical protein